MPMATEITRRRSLRWLAAGSAVSWLPAFGTAAPSHTRLVAAWAEAGGYRLGVLQADAETLAAASALALPTRAHGLLPLTDGSVLAVARRPGDWLLRWTPGAAAAQWHWIEAGRAFNGHVIASPDGATLYTTETDLDSGAGLVGVRDAATLAKRAEWPTQGIDPHQLVWDRRPGPPALIVANGGVATRPETGRVKLDLDRMDASLVRLDARGGALRGQWRLDDRRLSLRHLAWAHGERPLLGIALQAEHAPAEARAGAPVLARFDGQRLVVVPAPQPLAGYGGDIAAQGDGWAVSCPRAGGVALFGADGGWRGWVGLSEACALSPEGERLWAGGPGAAATLAAGGDAPQPLRQPLRLDNHWAVIGP